MPYHWGDDFHKWRQYPRVKIAYKSSFNPHRLIDDDTFNKNHFYIVFLFPKFYNNEWIYEDIPYVR